MVKLAHLITLVMASFHVGYSVREGGDHDELPISHPNPPDFTTDKSNDYDLAYPQRNEQNELEFHPHQHLAYACPPDKNKHAEFLQIDEDYQNNLFLIKVDKSTPWNEVTCDREIIPTLIPLNGLQCGPSSRTWEIGYMVNKWDKLYWKPFRCIDFIINQVDKLAKTDGFFWLDFVRICEHEENGRVIHLSHTIVSPKTLVLEDEDTESEMAKYSSSDVNVDFSFYDKEKQKKILSHLLQNSSSYDPDHDYFIPQQLIPHQDMQFETWKKSTYFDFNYAPMWKSIHEGNWILVNNRIRKVAKCNVRNGLEEPISIFSGTYDVLKINGNPVVLDENYIQFATVPLLFWKVLYDKYSLQALAIITLNDIYVDDPKQYEFCEVCQDCCKTFENSDIKKGYTYCCKVDNELKEKLYLTTEIGNLVGHLVWEDEGLRRFCKTVAFPPVENEDEEKNQEIENIQQIEDDQKN